MTFKQIGQIALDGVDGALLARMKRAVEGSADEALTLRSTAGKGGDRPPGEGKQPVAYAQQGEVTRAQTVIRAFRETTTAIPAASKGQPRPSAVVVSLNAWKLAHSAGTRSAGAV